MTRMEQRAHDRRRRIPIYGQDRPDSEGGIKRCFEGQREVDFFEAGGEAAIEG